MPRIAPRPVLLIEALNGNPDEVLNEVYAARGGRRRELWKVARAGTPARSPPRPPSTSSGSSASSTAACGESAAFSVAFPDGGDPHPG